MKNVQIAIVAAFLGALTLQAQEMIQRQNSGGASMNGIDFLCKKALIIMLDGVRSDTLEAIQHPLWDRLKKNIWQESYASVWSLHARPVKDAAPNSAPNHVAILTGASAAQHKVFNNGEIAGGNYEQYPTFLEILAKSGHPGIFCFTWEEDKFAGKEQTSVLKKHGTDQGNTDFLAQRLSEKDAPDVSVIYLDDADHIGHKYQFSPFSPEYKAAVQKAMQNVQILLDAIAGRQSFQQEDWLIVLCSDHGGYGRNHGMPGGQASTIPLLVCSRRMQSIPNCMGLNVCDIAPVVLKHFRCEEGKQIQPCRLSCPYVFRFIPPKPTEVAPSRPIVSAGNGDFQFSVFLDEKGYFLHLQNSRKALKLFHFPSDKTYDRMTIRIHSEGLAVFSATINNTESFISDELGTSLDIRDIKTLETAVKSDENCRSGESQSEYGMLK